MLTVQRSVYVVSCVPVNILVGFVEVANVPPLPVTTVHVPVPTVGAFAASVAEVPHNVWSGPALDVVGFEIKFITSVYYVNSQAEYEIVHTIE